MKSNHHRKELRQQKRMQSFEDMDGLASTVNKKLKAEERAWKNRGGVKMRDFEAHAISYVARPNKKQLTVKLKSSTNSI